MAFVSLAVGVIVLESLLRGEPIEGLTERWRRASTDPFFVVLGCVCDWLGLAAGVRWVRRDLALRREL